MALIDLSDLKMMYPDDTYGLIDAFISRIKLAQDQKSYKNAFVVFHTATGGADLLTGSTEAFSAYVSYISKLCSSGQLRHSTVCKYHKIIASFMSYCLDMAEHSEVIPKNFENKMLFFPLKAPQDVIRLSHTPSLTDIDKLIGYLKTNDELTLIAVLLSLRCYLKSGEFINLKTGDIFEAQDGKYYVDLRGRKRVVPLPEDVANIIAAYFETNLMDGDYLFSSKRSNHLSINMMDARLGKACTACGISYTFNDIRNAAAVYSSSFGASETQISEAMGYKTTAHIKKLSSLYIPVEERKDYVNIVVK